MMRKIAFFFSILITNFCLANTAKITGTLTLSNGEPAAFAVVYIDAVKKYCSSNEKGQYELTDVPYGKHYIEVKTIEAEPLKQLIEINKPVVKLSFKLKHNEKFNLDEVLILGKNESSKLKEKGFAVSMIETQKAALQSIQATELLDRTSGVRIRQSGGMGSQIQYNINGLSGNSVRVFIDGIPIRNYGSSFSLSSIPPEQIERIEVYKGVVPAYLSEDALGGAINVVLKKKLKSRNDLSVSYSYGSFNTHQGSVNGGYRDDKTGFSVDVSAHYNSTDNDYKVWGNQVYVPDPETNKLKYIKAKRFHDSYESYGVRANIGFTDVKWADNFTLGLLYSDMSKDVQNGGTMKVVYGNRRTGQDIKMGSLKYEKKNLLINKLNLTSFVSYTQGNRWVVDTIPYIYHWDGKRQWDEANNDYYKWNTTGEQGTATLAENKEKTIAGRANLSYELHPRHRVSANYLYNRFVRDVEDPLLPRAEQELTETRYLTKQILGFTYENNFFDERLRTSLFLKHYIQSVKLTDPVKTNNILTALEYDKSIDHNGYGITASYALWPRFLLQASYEKALRMPENDELLGNTSESVDSTYDLEPEKSYNYNIGFIAGPFDFGSHQLRTDVNFFIRDIRDMIMRGESSTDGTYGYENLGKVMSRGFDSEVGYNYHRKLFVTYNLSVFNARYRLRYNENGVEYAYYNDRLRNAPYFTMNANMEYVLSNIFQKGSRLSFNYNFAYVHEFFRNWESIGGANLDMIPTQKVNDLGIVYSFPRNKVTLSVNAKNILNEQVFDNWALQKPGRAFFGKISYKIF